MLIKRIGKEAVMKQDNRGMTLVELIIAMTISVVILGAATLFIGSAQRNLQTATNVIDLQMESQVLMEQLATWIMEGNGVKVDGDVLVVYYIPRKTDTALPSGVTLPTESEKRIIWRKDDKLYMMVVDGIADPDTDTTVVTDADATQEHCISEYMKDFTPAVDAGNHSKITITVQMEKGIKEYELENEITLRNEWMLSRRGGMRYEEVA